MNSRILGIGNALVDILVKINDESIYEKYGLKRGGMEMIDADKKRIIHKDIKQLEQVVQCGGSTANTMLGLAKLGATAGYIGKIANDEAGMLFKNDMEKAGVTTHFLYSEVDTGIATTFINPGGERTFATYLGAAATMLPREMNVEIFKKYDIIHVEGYLIFNRALILEICRLAKACGVKISMDMASYNLVEQMRDLMGELLRDYVDIIFANEDEAQAFTGKQEHEAIEILSEYCPVVVVKLGERGSIVKMDGVVTDIPAVTATCVDTTGAGDIFASGFLYGLMKQLPVQKIGEIASSLGAESVQTIGAHLSDEQWDKVLGVVLRN